MAESNESFGLRHELPSGLVPDIPEKDIRTGRGPGTSETDGGGDLRGVRDRDSRDGTDGGPYPPAGIVRAVKIDRGRCENHKVFERDDVRERAKQMIREICEAYDIEIEEMELMEDQYICSYRSRHRVRLGRRSES